MDSKIKKIIELCRFEEDPTWEIMKGMFHGVTFDNYHSILNRRNYVVQDLIDESRDAVKVNNTNIRDFLVDDGKCVRVTEPIVVWEKVVLPEYNTRIDFPVHLGKNVRLNDTVIATMCYVDNSAELEFVNIDSDRATYVGENVKLSHIPEVRGCFFSGGPLKSVGRSRTYMHATSLNNTIVGAYSGISVGTNVYNHPLAGDTAFKYDPENDKMVGSDVIKLPILLGLESSIGANCLINSGAIVEAGARVPSCSNIFGYNEK